MPEEIYSEVENTSSEDSEDSDDGDPEAICVSHVLLRVFDYKNHTYSYRKTWVWLWTPLEVLDLRETLLFIAHMETRQTQACA